MTARPRPLRYRHKLRNGWLEALQSTRPPTLKLGRGRASDGVWVLGIWDHNPDHRYAIVPLDDRGPNEIREGMQVRLVHQESVVHKRLNPQAPMVASSEMDPHLWDVVHILHNENTTSDIAAFAILLPTDQPAAG